ncbi:MAG: 1-(5-phosphoribosyl)-5-[(5-phosphoribosylamino)methylideneamino]imidazole-4-carboxamide isomerase [Chloroflexi bacterium]|nr:1-(5-phosphoribosyl)-5-[(5-phosphoribosylamino)methylideneamino]imidazole-4-carboxamide isomerase [Chloroflexota bacterium]MCY3696011.1 1-(5-phosphoribosyl)-5-[(5-phosphoribosylamino)methylideneamino]imidazole-4-carboxamide isomerase [Chloroflexota bacterium]MYB22276.1 1-(5-phosphoribosyl)-5-[(5-phosphoribosylamino)methylideneamino]imidazole-4-carboxamide isomerase [Chloroflexota bacterium]MYF80647.1 1-(5-phosphoribosyl)-5-[(5-phosphoribosylamino)methylideneamino]imidazole-4-carboxamide isome
MSANAAANMIDVLPAIDIRGGRCVRLVQGDYERETVFDDDPLAPAQRWIDEGAEMLHVIDLDGAREGRAANAGVVEQIAALGKPLQVGGGIRNRETLQRYLDAGVARVIVGTAAVTDRDFLREAIGLCGSALTVSVDARGGRVALNGWTEASELPAVALIPQLEDLGVRRFIYTDIASDGMLGGHDEAEFARVAAAGRSPVIAAGGIAHPMQVRRLAANGAAGVVLGRALYDGRLTLADALDAAEAGLRERTC